MTETTPIRMDMPDSAEIRALSNLIKHSLRIEASLTDDPKADADAALTIIMPRTIAIFEEALRHVERGHDDERLAATMDSRWLASLLMSRASLYQNPEEFLEHIFQEVRIALPYMLKARGDAD